MNSQSNLSSISFQNLIDSVSNASMAWLLTPAATRYLLLVTNMLYDMIALRLSMMMEPELLTNY